MHSSRNKRYLHGTNKKCIGLCKQNADAMVYLTDNGLIIPLFKF